MGYSPLFVAGLCVRLVGGEGCGHRCRRRWREGWWWSEEKEREADKRTWEETLTGLRTSVFPR